jgi:hypothetical protein
VIQSVVIFVTKKTCNLTGECTRGCVSGHFGPFCEYVCPENCLFNSCSKVGKCVDGCIIGFYGDTCTNRCLQPCANLTCDRKLGTCKQTYNGKFSFHVLLYGKRRVMLN